MSDDKVVGLDGKPVQISEASGDEQEFDATTWLAGLGEQLKAADVALHDVFVVARTDRGQVMMLVGSKRKQLEVNAVIGILERAKFGLLVS